MEKQPSKKGRILLLLGMATLVLGLTVFRENNTPKMIMNVASIILLLASIYFNSRSKKKIDNSGEKE